MTKRNVAIIGTQGLPAKYGGFETLVENIVDKQISTDIQYTVYCSRKDYDKKLTDYKGALLEYIPFHANGIQSILYDICSIFKARHKNDILLILGVSGCLILPILKKIYKGKVIVNIDGLEHRRAKWGRLAKWFLYRSERIAVKYADTIITDNKGIHDYVWQTYKKNTELIAYGGDHVIDNNDNEKKSREILNEYNVKMKSYSLSICRIEPENNCHIILEAFAQSKQKLLFIGNWDICEYGKKLKEKYAKYENILIQSPQYDLNILYVLRKNCQYYIHGHSAGGTNPSLVEAMFFGVPILAFNVIYNKVTTENKAHYFETPEELLALANELKAFETKENATAMKDIAHRKYKWSDITRLYEQLYQ